MSLICSMTGEGTVQILERTCPMLAKALKWSHHTS